MTCHVMSCYFLKKMSVDMTCHVLCHTLYIVICYVLCNVIYHVMSSLRCIFKTSLTVEASNTQGLCKNKLFRGEYIEEEYRERVMGFIICPHLQQDLVAPVIFALIFIESFHPKYKVSSLREPRRLSPRCLHCAKSVI